MKLAALTYPDGSPVGPAPPLHTAAHRALTLWMSRPANTSIDGLHFLLVDIELRYRLMDVLRSSDLQRETETAMRSIPVEEVTFSNPEHRTTVLEFKADATRYGA